MFEQKEVISLDQQSFKALAGEKRISILKSLNERRKTQTELSNELKISVPTIKEHLELLEKACLVQEINDNHKWKYFELTRKGQKLLKPNEDMKIMLVLSTSFIAMLAGIISIILSLGMAGTGALSAAKETGNELMKASAGLPLQGSATDLIAESAVQKGTEVVSNNALQNTALDSSAMQNGTNAVASNLNLIALIQNHLPEIIFILIMLVIFVIFLIRLIKSKKALK